MKRGPKPCLVELPLTTWMNECADQMVCPTLTEIKDEAIAMAEKKTSVQNPALPCKFGKTWWKQFKRRKSDFVSTLAQNVESERASAPLSTQQWTEFFNHHLKPGLEKVADNPCHIWNEDESGFFRQFTRVGQRVRVRKGKKNVAQRRGWQQQHITAIVAVNAQGQATKPALLWNTKKIRGDMFLRTQCPVTLKGTPDGWSSQEVFPEWVETVLVKETQPLSNPQKCILLLVDGSKTHLTLQGLQKMKSSGVEVVVFTPHLTDVIQPLDKAVFSALKASFRKKEKHWKRKNHHRAPCPADFVQLWTDAYVDAVTPRNILSGFRSCGISPFDHQFFLEHCPRERIQHQDPPACPASPTHSPVASQDPPQNSSQGSSQNSSAAPSQVSLKSDASTQCSGRAISAATRDDPWSLRLGGFVTAQDFLDKVSEKENGAAAKPAPKRRARRVGEPLRWVDRPAAKRPAQPAPKPRAGKRRRVDDPAPAAAPGPDEAQFPSDEGDGAGDLFDLYVSYQSSC